MPEWDQCRVVLTVSPIDIAIDDALFEPLVEQVRTSAPADGVVLRRGGLCASSESTRTLNPVLSTCRHRLEVKQSRHARPCATARSHIQAPADFRARQLRDLLACLPRRDVPRLHCAQRQLAVRSRPRKLPWRRGAKFAQTSFTALAVRQLALAAPRPGPAHAAISFATPRRSDMHVRGVRICALRIRLDAWRR
jgi:hypothetical protein